MDTAASLDAGFLVGGEDAVGLAQGCTFPLTVIQIEHSAGLALEGRIAREDPGAMRPRTDRILAEPAPQRRLPDRGDQAALDNLAVDLRHAPARKRHLRLVGELASEPLIAATRLGGKSAGRPLRDCSSKPRSLSR